MIKTLISVIAIVGLSVSIVLGSGCNFSTVEALKSARYQEIECGLHQISSPSVSEQASIKSKAGQIDLGLGVDNGQVLEDLINELFIDEGLETHEVHFASRVHSRMSAQQIDKAIKKYCAKRKASYVSHVLAAPKEGLVCYDVTYYVDGGDVKPARPGYCTDSELSVAEYLAALDSILEDIDCINLANVVPEPAPEDDEESN